MRVHRHVRHFLLCSWLFRATWYSFIACLSSRAKLTGRFKSKKAHTQLTTTTCERTPRMHHQPSVRESFLLSHWANASDKIDYCFSAEVVRWLCLQSRRRSAMKWHQQPLRMKSALEESYLLRVAADLWTKIVSFRYISINFIYVFTHLKSVLQVWTKRSWWSPGQNVYNITHLQFSVSFIPTEC